MSNPVYDGLNRLLIPTEHLQKIATVSDIPGNLAPNACLIHGIRSLIHFRSSEDIDGKYVKKVEFNTKCRSTCLGYILFARSRISSIWKVEFLPWRIFLYRLYITECNETPGLVPFPRVFGPGFPDSSQTRSNLRIRSRLGLGIGESSASGLVSV